MIASLFSQRLAVFAAVAAVAAVAVYPEHPQRPWLSLALGLLVAFAHRAVNVALSGGRGWGGRPQWKSASYLALHAAAALALVALAWAASRASDWTPPFVVGGRRRGAPAAVVRGW